MAKDQTISRILVGVTYGQPDTVLRHAAHFARTFGAALICAHVDPGRYVVEELPDGSVVSLPLDPELPELKDTDFDEGLVAQVRNAVADVVDPARWSPPERRMAIHRCTSPAGKSRSRS